MKNKAMVAVAATPANKIVVVVKRPQWRQLSSSGVMTASVLHELTPTLAVDIVSPTVMTLLSKIGIRKASDLILNTNKFLRKAKEEELAAVISAADRTLFCNEFMRRVSVEIEGSYLNGKREQVVTSGGAWALVRFVSVVGVRLAQALGIPHSRVFTEYLLTKKGTKVPAALKALSKAPKSAKKFDITAVELTKLRPADFEDHNAELLAALPKLFLTYANEKKAKAKKALAEFKKTNRTGYYDSAGMRMSRNRKLTKFVQAVNDIEEKLPDTLKSEVTAEMFTFFQHTIPALTKKRTNSQAYNKVLTLERRIRMTQRKVRPTSNMSPGLQARYKLSNAKLKAKVKELRDELKTLKGAGKVEITGKIKSWMHGYIDTGSSTKDAGLLLHRLVEQANHRKLKKGAAELKSVLDSNSVLLLTYAGIGNILDALEGSTVKAANTVFKDVLASVKPKLFTYEMSESFGKGLDTPTGRVTNQRLLRLNSITAADETAMVKQYQKEVEGWNPLKVEAVDLIKKLDAKASTKAATYTVTKSSAKQLAAYRKDLPHFMTHVHTIGISIVRAWECEPSPQIKTLLKNMQKKKSDLKVIRNVFHGCSKQAGSIILHSGFKIKGTMVTARAMGDVLYIAPNVDKSAQYMGDRGMSRRGGTSGIVFMGDIIVKGVAKRGKVVGTKAGPSSNSGVKVDSPYDWTKTSFTTEEIGLVNPNMQFIIRHVFLLKVMPKHVGEKPDANLAKSMLKFEAAIPLQQYLKE